MRTSVQMQAGQQLALTPLLQRAIQLLQLSSLEFMQEVQQSVISNPFLEPADADASSDVEPVASASAPAERTDDSRADAAAAEAPSEVVWHDGAWESRGGGYDRDDEWDPALLVPESRTLRAHLLEQAGLLNLSERDATLVQTVIEALDDSGYLTTALEDLQLLFPDADRPSMEEMQIALRHVQCLEPAGVGARSVSECLELQLLALPDDEPGRTCALGIVRHHLELVAARDFQRLLKELGCDDDELGRAMVLIRKLTPRPGSGFGADQVQFVVADVIVRKVRGKWTASINPQVVPRIRLNQVYAGIFQSARESGNAQVSQQLAEARWLLRNLEQRFSTIQRVAQAIVDRQTRFFDYGEVAMKPLTLRDIADELNLHESTVSRVTSRKYMATPRGLLEFKHFFGSHVETAEGSPCSSTAVRALIRQLIGNEDPGKPYSDIQVTRMLERRGIKVARRTVAKYRDLLRIPPVEIRRLAHRGASAPPR